MKKQADTIKKPRISRLERQRLKRERIAAEKVKAADLHQKIKTCLGGGATKIGSQCLVSRHTAVQEKAGSHRAPVGLRHSAAAGKGMGGLLSVVGYQS